MTDQEYLEKPYYWNEDSDGNAPKQAYIGHAEPIGNYKKKRTREDRLNTFIPKVAEPPKPMKRVNSKLTIGWSGIQAYFEQCARSEKQN